MIAESPIHVECRVFSTIDVPPERVMFLAEVTATTVHEGVCDKHGRLIVENVPFFGMTAGSGEFYTMDSDGRLAEEPLGTLEYKRQKKQADKKK